MKDNFIADTHPDDLADLPAGGETDDRRHRELDRRREMEASMDAEKQADLFKQRYAKSNRHGRVGGDSAVVPRRLLLPSVDDPSIWAVKCKEGKEREVVFSIMKRIEERMGSKDELAITCAFERGGTQSTMKGFIYVEAQRQADISEALKDLMNVYPRTKMMLVEIKEMPDLLRVAKPAPLQPGAYVRMKRPPKYAGDLAQVIDLTETGLEIRIRYVPRLDYGLLDDPNAPAGDSAKRKRVAAGPRPPPRLFSENDARKRHAKYLSGRADSKQWLYMGDEYINGYCEKEVKLQHLDTKDISPTLEEVTRFSAGVEDGTENLDLQALANSLRASTANASYLPGDVIEVYEGEQKGVIGKAVSVQADIVTMAVTAGPLKGQTIEVPVKGLRKRFKEGDHVKVIGGSKYRDEVGMVVKIRDDKVTILTDHSNNEVTVFSKDLREASDSGGGGSLGQFELWDLVQLDPATVACIVKVERESLVVLDQNSTIRNVLPSQISNKLDQRRHAVATDRNGSEIHVDDGVKEFGGESRTGKIIHIHRAYLFLKSPSQSENAGVFVTRTTNVATVSAKGGRLTATVLPDLNGMNPAMQRNPKGNGAMAPPPAKVGRDRSIGQTVTICKGPYKGLLGIVKETTDENARVELHTKSKTVNVPKDALRFKDRMTGQTIDPLGRGGRSNGGGDRGGFTPRGRGAPTPGGWDGGRTPVAASGGFERTPAWGSRSKLSVSTSWILTNSLQHLVDQQVDVLQLGNKAVMQHLHGTTTMDHAPLILMMGVVLLTVVVIEHQLGHLEQRHQHTAKTTPSTQDPRHQVTPQMTAHGAVPKHQPTNLQPQATTGAQTKVLQTAGQATTLLHLVHTCQRRHLELRMRLHLVLTRLLRQLRIMHLRQQQHRRRQRAGVEAIGVIHRVRWMRRRRGLREGIMRRLRRLRMGICLRLRHRIGRMMGLGMLIKGACWGVAFVF